MKTLDEINSAFNGFGFYREEPNERRVGPYRVFFSGFMAAQQNMDLIGHIHAWPAEKVADPHYFVGVICGKGWGRYEPGAYFDIRPGSESQRHFRHEDFETEEGIESAKRSILLGIEIIASMVADDLAGRPVPILPPVRWVPIDPLTGDRLEDDLQPIRTRIVFQEHQGIVDGVWGTYRVPHRQRLEWVDQGMEASVPIERMP